MPFGVGIWELLALLGVLLLVVGPKKLPDIGRTLGSGARELRESLAGQAASTESIPSEPEGTR